MWEVVLRGDTNNKRKKNTKIKMTRREPSRKGDQQSIRQKPKGGHTDKRSTHNNKQCQNKSLNAAFTKQTDA